MRKNVINLQSLYRFFSFLRNKYTRNLLSFNSFTNLNKIYILLFTVFSLLLLYNHRISLNYVYEIINQMYIAFKKRELHDYFGLNFLFVCLLMY